MRSKVFKSLLLGSAMVCGVLGGTSQAASIGLPVMDTGLDMTNQQGFQSVSNGIRNQTEGIVNAIDYMGKAVSKIIVDTETASVKTTKALDTMSEFSPQFAKTSTACATFDVSKSRGGGATGYVSEKVAEYIAMENFLKNTRTADLPYGVPRDLVLYEEAINRLGDEKDSETVQVFRSVPFDPSDMPKVQEAVAYATNPLPQRLPDRETLKEVAAAGSPDDKSSYGRALVHNDRLMRMQQVLTEIKLKDMRAPVSDSVKEIIGKMTLTEEQKKLFKGDLSPNQVNEVMATSRVTSADWVTEIHARSNMMGTMNDMAMMQAEQLRLLWSIDRNIEKLLTVMALAETTRLNQSGGTTH